MGSWRSRSCQASDLATFFCWGLRTLLANSGWWLGNHQELPVRLVSQLPQIGTPNPPFGILIHLDQSNSVPLNRFTPSVLLCALRSALPSPQRLPTGNAETFVRRGTARHSNPLASQVLGVVADAVLTQSSDRSLLLYENNARSVRQPHVLGRPGSVTQDQKCVVIIHITTYSMRVK